MDVLRAYSTGQLGTREAIERAGMHDYADLIIGLAQNDLVFRRPKDTAAHKANVEQLLFSSRFCAVAVNIRMVVTDAVPLITLAVARSLDYLLYPEQPVLIPDAVFHEATAAAGKLGAQEIIDWYRARIDAVRYFSTGDVVS